MREAAALDARGLACTGCAFSKSVEGLKAAIDLALEIGAVHLNIIGQVFPFGVEDGAGVIRAWLAMCEKAGVPSMIETHRDRITTDMCYMLQLMEAVPEMPVCAKVRVVLNAVIPGLVGHRRECPVLAISGSEHDLDECPLLLRKRTFSWPSLTSVPDPFRTLALPKEVEHWSLTTLREELVKIGVKVVSHGQYVTVQMAEVAVPRGLFQKILRLIDELRSLAVCGSASMSNAFSYRSFMLHNRVRAARIRGGTRR